VLVGIVVALGVAVITTVLVTTKDGVASVVKVLPSGDVAIVTLLVPGAPEAIAVTELIV
jgi:hypothetical protein